jgi:uncharacterized protein YrrD
VVPEYARGERRLAMEAPITLNELRGFSVNGTDGPIGKIEDFYFDERTWKIRYIVVHTSKLSVVRDVLVLPQSMERPSRWTSQLLLNITREQVGKSPDVDTDMPVSRQYEVAVGRQYGVDVYFSWADGFMGSHNLDLSGYEFPSITRNKDGKEFDPHLFSIKAVTGMQINSLDGKAGHVKDFMIDQNAMLIRFLVVEAGNLFVTKKVIVRPLSAAKIDADGRAIKMNISKVNILESPEYDPLAAEPFDERAVTEEKNLP